MGRCARPLSPDRRIVERDSDGGPMRRSVWLAMVVAVSLASGLILPSAAGAAPGVSRQQAAVRTAGLSGAAAVLPGAFVPIGPARVIDTRTNGGPVPAFGDLVVVVAGQQGIPLSGIAVVAMNLTAVGASAAGYLSVYASRTARPGTSSLNFDAGATVANLALVPVGADGRVVIHNGSPGSVQVLADVTGYTLAGTPTTRGSYQSVPPWRAVDTRDGTGGIRGAFYGGMGTQFYLSGHGVPTFGVAAVVVNLTATRPSQAGWLAAWADIGAHPARSDLSFGAGQTVSNLVVVPVDIYTQAFFQNGSSGSVFLLVDVVGYVRAGLPTGAGTYRPVSGPRLFDTRRPAPGRPAVAVPAGSSLTLTVAGAAGLPASGIDAAVLAVTVVGAQRPGYLTAYTSGRPRPSTSSINFQAGQTVSGLIMVPVGADGRVVLDNRSTGSINLVVDTDGFTVAGPSPIPAVATQVSSGGRYSCAVTQDGSLWCWGTGPLGNDVTSSSSTPVAAAGTAPGIRQVSAGSVGACAVTVDGAARCWGDNRFGSLGNGTTLSSAVAVPVTGLTTGVAQVAMGDSFSCALLTSGAVQCWGLGGWGQLGDGQLRNSSTAVAVSGLDGGAVGISAGNSFACATMTTGSVRCWGLGYFGQPGSTGRTVAPTPQTVPGLPPNVVSVTSGFAYSCAATGDGRAFCWGANDHGQLGDGTMTTSSVPVPVSGLTDVAMLSSGYDHACAALTTGGAMCWGSNGSGELGDGTTALSTVPVAVISIGDAIHGAVQFAAGGEHTCAVSTISGVLCWGANAQGQVGVGSVDQLWYAEPVNPVGF